MRERLLWTAAIGSLWAIGYFGVAHLDVHSLRDAAIALDGAIPFVAASVWPYLAGIALPALPVFALRGRALLRRTAIAYALAIGASFATFTAWPVTSAALRADLTSLPHDSVTTVALRTLYALDPPCNLFPSLHVSLGTLAALSLAIAAPRLRCVAIAAIVLNAVSVCTVKQHFVIDVAGALALAGVAASLLLAPARRTGPGDDALSMRGIAVFAAMASVTLACAWFVSAAAG